MGKERKVKTRARLGALMILLAFPLFLGACAPFGATYPAPRVVKAEEVPRIAKETVKSLLNNPGMLIIDVRTEKEWANTTQKIKGAVHQDSHAVEAWGPTLPKDKRLVLYCS
jgi:hypothetical protein